MVKVSVIVPVYNVEKYLRKCVTSLINQTLKEIEIILVSDASPDGSELIMKEFEESYPQVTCIYLSENKSQGGARNEGLKVARGEYIAFVDSDDYVDQTIFEKLYNKAIQSQCDMTFCMFQRVKEEGTYIKSNFLYPPEYAGNITDTLRKAYLNSTAYTWGKLYKRELIYDNHIWFPEKLKHEDSYFMALISFYITKTAMVSEFLYYYVQRGNSVMNSKSNPYYYDQIKVVDLYLAEVKKRGLYSLYKEEIDYFVIKRRYLNILKKSISLHNEETLGIMKEVRHFIKEYYPQYKSNSYYLNMTGEERFLLYLTHFSPRLGLFWETKCNHWIKKIDRDRIARLYYDKFYRNRISKIKELLHVLSKEEYHIAITGADLKKRALLQVLDMEEKCYLKKYSIDISKDNLVENSTWINDIDAVLVINPSFYCGAFEFLQKIKPSIQIISLEEYLMGYVDLAHYLETTENKNKDR